MADNTFTDKEIALITDDAYFATLTFINPRSPQWGLVRQFCLKADNVVEYKKNLTAAFLKNENSIKLLLTVCELVSEWKTVHLFINQKRIKYIYSVTWLSCYLKSLQCADKRAWCLSVTEVPQRVEFNADITIKIDLENLEHKLEKFTAKEAYVCPCKKLAHYRWGYRELPTDLKYQFQAFAIEQGFADCINFNIDEFEPVFPLIEIK